MSRYAETGVHEKALLERAVLVFLPLWWASASAWAASAFASRHPPSSRKRKPGLSPSWASVTRAVRPWKYLPEPGLRCLANPSAVRLVAVRIPCGKLRIKRLSAIGTDSPSRRSPPGSPESRAKGPPYLAAGRVTTPASAHLLRAGARPDFSPRVVPEHVWVRS
jgi:hypothetical protein